MRRASLSSLYPLYPLLPGLPCHPPPAAGCGHGHSGADWPHRVEALPCSVTQVPLLHPFTLCLICQGPAQPKGLSAEVFPISSRACCSLGLPGRALQAGSVCCKQWWPWRSGCLPDPGALSGEGFRRCHCVLTNLTPRVPWVLPSHCASGQGMEHGGLRDVHSAGTNT